ncbi:neisseria meningitidis TspB family protein [Neisseria lactamica ATCC 23970]|nr:neisseria meningitidis TspB family protein [Neisseria lactamica ATCC 23970]
MAGVGKLARLGAKFSTRAVPYVGTALLAHDIYETFKEDIQEQGYQYDPKTDKFVKGYEYSNCIWYRVGDYPHEKLVNDSCYGVDSSTMRLMSDYSRFPEVKELMEARMEILGRKYWEKLRNRPDMVSYKITISDLVNSAGTAEVVQFIKEMIIEVLSIFHFQEIQNTKKKWMPKSWKRFYP